jgi:addiction module HigA family antidote
MRESVQPQPNRGSFDASHTEPSASPAEALKRHLAQKGWSQVDLAWVLDMTPQTVCDICNGRRGISYRMAWRLAAAFGNDAMYWANVQSRYDLSRAKPPKPGIAERRAAVEARRTA